MNRSQDELEQLQVKTAWAWIYVGLVTDLIELQLIILTIAYSIVQYKRGMAMQQNRQISISISL